MCKPTYWNTPGESYEQALDRHIADKDRLQRYQYDLIAEISSLHDCISGISSPGPAGMNAASARLIRRRLDEWEPSTLKRCEVYDNAVKTLCQAVLSEYSESWLKDWEDREAKSQAEQRKSISGSREQTKDTNAFYRDH